MIEKPTPVKKKRGYVLIYLLLRIFVDYQHNSAPPPGSKAYKELPAVSVS